MPQPFLVPDALRRCPRCAVELGRVCLKTTAAKLAIQPSRFVVTQIQVDTCACPKCHQYMVSAPTPDEVVDRGILGNELLVGALVDHYQDAVPFERMERNARAEGVPLAANTVASSVGKLIDLFDPVVGHIRERCLSSRFTALDATGMPVLDPVHPLGIKTGALWLIEGDHRYACFLYAPSGHAAHLKKFFEGRTLQSVMCDGSPTNNCVETQAGGRRGGCNAHYLERRVIRRAPERRGECSGGVVRCGSVTPDNAVRSKRVLVRSTGSCRPRSSGIGSSRSGARAGEAAVRSPSTCRRRAGSCSTASAGDGIPSRTSRATESVALRASIRDVGARVAILRGPRASPLGPCPAR